MKTLAAIVLLAVSIAPVSASAQAQAKPQAPAPAQATNLTGDWHANFTRTAPTGQTQTITFTFHFTQKGKELTGTIGPEPARQWKIEKGVVDGTKVNFVVQQPDGPLRALALTLVKGHLQGTMKLTFPDATTADVVVDAERAPAK